MSSELVVNCVNYPMTLSDSHVFNDSAALYDLPSELICEIILHVAFPSACSRESRVIFQDFLSITSACKSLRNLGRSIRQVWAWHLDFSRSITSIEHFLELSHPLPLIISLPNFICDPQCCLEGVPLRGNHPRYKHWDLLIRNNILRNRCEALRFSVDYCMWDMLRLQIEHCMTALKRLDIAFKPEGMIFGHVIDSPAFPPQPFTSSCVFPELTSLTLSGGFFNLSAAMFPALEHLSIEMEPEDERGFQDNLVTGGTQLIYRNWTASKWHNLLVSLPSLKTVFLKHAIQFEDSRLSQFQTFFQTIDLSNLESFSIEDYHSSLAKFLRPCLMSPQCNIKIRSALYRHDLSRQGPINANINLALFLRNRFILGKVSESFGESGYVKVQQRINRRDELGAHRWDMEIGNIRGSERDAHDSGLLDLKLTVRFPNDNAKWRHRSFFLLHQMLKHGLGKHIAETTSLRFVLNIGQTNATCNRLISFVKLRRFIERHT